MLFPAFEVYFFCSSIRLDLGEMCNTLHMLLLLNLCSLVY
jgi:hypothetical protein